MSFHLPQIYPITDTVISSLSHCEQVRNLIEGGATFIQLREKHTAARAFFTDAQDALRLARSAGATIIINDRVDIAMALGADGVHLGQSDLPVAAARKLLGENAIIGFSTHSIKQAKAALDLPIDYLAFGPIYPTRSKRNPDPVVGLKTLRIIKSLAGGLPVVGIGGINHSSVGQVLSAGADAASVISALLANSEKMAGNFRKLVNLASGKPY